jgi:hypothetical protein
LAPDSRGQRFFGGEERESEHSSSPFPDESESGVVPDHEGRLRSR